MNRRLLMVVCVLVVSMAWVVRAVEPNYVRTTTYDVDGNITASDDNDVVTTEYSDGLGRPIQSKLRLNDTKDRVTCSFYDNVGRPAFVTKPFADDESPNAYLAGELHSTAIEGQLEDQYPVTKFPNNEHLYTETMYWNDPLGQVKTVLGPGRTEDFGFPRSWTIGVVISNVEYEHSVTDIGSVIFKDGYITKFDFPLGIDYSSTPIRDVVSLMDAVYEGFLTSNPFTQPSHFLTVSRAPDEKITQELKDVFGRTVLTFTSPDIQDGANLNAGLKILAEYEHDILGKTLEETPPKDAVNPLGNTKYHYNTLGQLIRKETPDGNTYDYEYYDNGLLNRMVLWNEDMTNHIKGIQYDYDDLGRETEIRDRLYSSNEVRGVIRKFYDNLDELKKENVFSPVLESEFNVLANLKGRLAGTITSNYIGSDKKIDVGELYSYNDDGRIDWKYVAIDGSKVVQKTVYFYDVHGKVTHEAFYYQLDHMVKRYTYDELGRLKKVEQGKPNSSGTDYTYTSFAEYTYDELGKMDEKLFTGITTADYRTSLDYDIRDRLTSIAGINNIGGGGVDHGFSETMAYSLGGNIDNVDFTYDFGAAAAETFDCSYNYDNVNRLGSATMTDNASLVTSYNYTYGASGRFNSKEEGSVDISNYSYYPNSNRLKTRTKNTVTSGEYVYDRNGNMVVDYTKKMVIEYDWRNQPVAFRFYDNDLTTLGIPRDANGTYNLPIPVSSFMSGKVKSGDINLVSSVVMLYDAGGNRVCKMGINE
ncbi:MAG: hypothetical protein JW863_14945 [Chitinispirillaceae bacterium]|nr:hypothetical protein [Chitinispirillaceae bacterium]